MDAKHWVQPRWRRHFEEIVALVPKQNMNIDCLLLSRVNESAYQENPVEKAKLMMMRNKLKSMKILESEGRSVLVRVNGQAV